MEEAEDSCRFRSPSMSARPKPGPTAIHAGWAVTAPALLDCCPTWLRYFSAMRNGGGAALSPSRASITTDPPKPPPVSQGPESPDLPRRFRPADPPQEPTPRSHRASTRMRRRKQPSERFPSPAADCHRGCLEPVHFPSPRGAPV